MKTYYNRGMKIAQRVVDYVSDYLYIDGVSEDDYTLNIEPFYNCREQGYKVVVENNNTWKTYFTFWVYAHRISDEPTITYTLEGRYTHELFDEEDWLERTKSFDNESKLEKYIINMILKHIEKDKEGSEVRR